MLEQSEIVLNLWRKPIDRLQFIYSKVAVSRDFLTFFYFLFRISPRKRFLRETIFTCLSGAQMGWKSGITKCQKSCDTATLKTSVFGKKRY